MKKLGEQLKEIRLQLRMLLINLYSSGKYSHQEVAEITGHDYILCFQFYDRWKNRCLFPVIKLTPRNKNKKYSILKEKLKEAYDAYLMGNSLQEVGNAYGGVSREAVRQMFKKNGLKIRKAGGGKNY